MKGAVIFLVFLIFLLLCAWIMKIIKGSRYGKYTTVHKVIDIIGTLLIIALLIAAAFPLFK